MTTILEICPLNKGSSSWLTEWIKIYSQVPFLKTTSIQEINHTLYSDFSKQQTIAQILYLLKNQVELNFWSKFLLTDTNTFFSNSPYTLLTKNEALSPIISIPQLVAQHERVVIVKRGHMSIVLIFIVIGCIFIFFCLLFYFYHSRFFRKYFGSLLRNFYQFFLFVIDKLLNLFNIFKKTIPIIEKGLPKVSEVSSPIIMDPKVAPGLNVLTKFVNCQEKIVKYKNFAQRLVAKMNLFKRLLETMKDESDLQQLQKLSKKLIANGKIFKNSSRFLNICIQKFPILLESLEWSELYELTNQINSFFLDFSNF